MRSFQAAILSFSLAHPKLIIGFIALITLVLGALILRVDVDTDPENMLASDNPVRVLNTSIKDEFGARDMIAIAIVDEGGVLNPTDLTAASRLIADIEQLPDVPDGVVSFRSATDVPETTLTEGDVDRIVAAVKSSPLLADRVLSPGSTGLAVFIPLHSKDEPNRLQIE